MGSDASLADLERAADQSLRAFTTIVATIDMIQPAIYDEYRRKIKSSFRDIVEKIGRIHFSTIDAQKPAHAIPSVLEAIRDAASDSQGLDLTAAAARLNQVLPAVTSLPHQVEIFFTRLASIASTIRTTLDEIEPDIGPQPNLTKTRR